MNWLKAPVLALILGSISVDAIAYCLLSSNGSCPQAGSGWPNQESTFQTQGRYGSTPTLDSAFEDAMGDWGGKSRFRFEASNEFFDPCTSLFIGRSDGVHAWTMEPTICFSDQFFFGASTLAVTLTWAAWDDTSAVEYIADADIYFNSKWTWDVHNGAGSNVDFQRVARHELGHVLGIGHDDRYTALMNPFYSQTVELPQSDDKRALIALYGSDIIPILSLLLL